MTHEQAHVFWWLAAGGLWIFAAVGLWLWTTQWLDEHRYSELEQMRRWVTDAELSALSAANLLLLLDWHEGFAHEYQLTTDVGVSAAFGEIAARANVPQFLLELRELAREGKRWQENNRST